MKQIVMFSRGRTSSYLAWLVAQEYGAENTILLHTPTYAESPDADRFGEEVAQYIGLSITTQAHGKSLWELIEDNNCLPSFHIPFCTTELKIKQSRKYWKTMQEDYTVHFGYGAGEWRRVQKQSTRLQSEGIKSKYLIFDRQIQEEQIGNIIRKEWKICLPETYRFLQHNNCIPCFKGGKGHFVAVAKYYPEQFLRAMALEKKIGHTVFKDCTLEDIWNKVQDGKLQESMFDDYESIPCMCSMD
jgi:hypothetical protein